MSKNKELHPFMNLIDDDQKSESSTTDFTKALSNVEFERKQKREKEQTLYEEIVIKFLQDNVKDIQQQILNCARRGYTNLEMHVIDGPWYQTNRLSSIWLSTVEIEEIFVKNEEKICQIFDNDRIRIKSHYLNTSIRITWNW